MSSNSRPELIGARDPVHWQDVLQDEPGEITERKIKIARQLGVPAILFSKRQIKDRIKDLQKNEIARHEYTPMDEQILYLALEKGGPWLASRMYGPIARTIGGKVEQDTYEIRINPPDGVFHGDGMQLKKPLNEDTVIHGKHVTFIDAAIRRGTTLRYLAGHFMDPSWTIHNAKGGTPLSVSAIALTARENIDLSEFPMDVSAGFTTPADVQTAGCGADEQTERLRFDDDIALSLFQKIGTEEQVAGVLEALGDRAVLGMDDIHFVDSIK